VLFYTSDVPRKNPMPVRERLICRRLREFRISLGLSQEDFCKSTGLVRTAYASYEYETSQLNYPAAWQILNTWPELNPQWLAGEDWAPMREWWFVDYETPEDTGLGPRAAFSLVYDWRMKSLLIGSRSGWTVDGKMPVLRVSPDARGRVIGRDKFARILGDWLAHQPDSKVVEFLDALLQRGSELLKEFPRDKDEASVKRRVAEMYVFEAKRRLALLNQDLSTAAKSQKDLLTHVTASGNVCPVKSTMADLLDRLNKATSQRGMKSKLAKVMDVPLSNVSQWLSGERTPGGETTLRLLHWVEQHERQQNALGSADNTAKGKTQACKSSNEKQTQVR